MDRNTSEKLYSDDGVESLSARRAWIETVLIVEDGKEYAVALRKESVDRNDHALAQRQLRQWSLSARRAWIETSIARKISADCGGRSPQGERG